MSKLLCDVCRQNPATVHVARIADGKMSKQHLCEECASHVKSGLDDAAQSFLAHLQESDGVINGDVINLDEIDADAIEQIFSENLDLPPDEMAELVAEVHTMLDEVTDDGDAFDGETFGDETFGDETFNGSEFDGALAEGETEDDGNFENEEATNDPFAGDAFSPVNDTAPAPGVLPVSGPLEVHSARCAKCGTTWDRLREDGRAGCAYCYEAFEDKLREVMARMQRETHHVGKTPRAAQRRRRRLEQLRDKRDHRLQMLQRRLQEAVAQENYEDAAALRDKIKMVSSTIVNDEV
jgi:protein-arginine kinase activator protein McsA